MSFSYNWLQSFFKRKLPSPEKLADLLSLHFVEVEEVRKEGKDFILDIDVKPNRGGDCFSHLGIAREIAAILNTEFPFMETRGKKRTKFSSPFKLEIADFKLIENKELKTKDFVTVDVKHQQACPRYTARVVAEIKVNPSPKWILERLIVCGLRPINNIVDIANYVMLETGQPLHAFDLEKLESVNPKSKILNPKQIPNSKSQIKKIIVRFAEKNEKIVTLDEEKYDLDENILIIADAKDPLAIAGIKGGKKAEIDEKTKIVVLEAANFNPKIIRRGSKKIDLKTDASWRFEHGIDPNLTEIAINRAAGLIQEIAGGKIAQGLIDFYPQRVLPKRIKLDLDYLKSLLGIEISKNETIKILKTLEFKIVDVKRQHLSVEIPTFRLDINIAEDLIEEIGRIYGYEKIPPKFPISILIPPKRNLEIFWEDMEKDILKEAGFTEVYNYSFLGQKECDIFGFKNPIEVENPTSADFQYLRPSLIPELLKNVATNQKFFEEIKIFELGKVFKNPQPKFGGREKRMLTGVMSGDAFYEAKGVIDMLLNKLGISNIWYDSYQPTPEESRFSIWHPKKCAEIKVNHEEIGFLGEISSKILAQLKIAGKVVIFDIDFEKLQRIASEEHEYQPISKYPAAIRDLAVLVPQEIRVAEVLNKIYDAGGNLIRDIDLFDIYEGEEIAEGKKNLAFHIIYQSADRTLTNKELDEIQEKIIKAFQEEPEWEVRK